MFFLNEKFLSNVLGRQPRVGRELYGVKNPGFFYLFALPQVASIPKITSWSKMAPGALVISSEFQQEGKSKRTICFLSRSCIGDLHLHPIGQNFVKRA